MKFLHELKEQLVKELGDIAKKRELSAGDLDVVWKLTASVKNIDKICMYAQEEDGGYSRSGEWEADMRGHYGDHSGRHYVRGHYSRDGGMSNDGGASNRGYSRNSYGGNDLKQRLQQLMDGADEEDRKMISKWMRSLDN